MSTKHTPGVWILGSTETPWSWTDRPNATDLRTHGGAVVFRGPHSLDYGVHQCRDAWVVFVDRPAGSRVGGSVREEVEEFSRFGDAIREARKLTRAALEKAGVL